MGFFDSLFSAFGSSSSADSGVTPAPAGASDPLGPSAIKFVNSFESSAAAGKPTTSPLDAGTKAPVMQIKSGKPIVESYEASANQQTDKAEAPSVEAPKPDQSGGQQAGNQQKSIEEQRRQWEFDKGIDSSLERGRSWPSNGKINSDYQLERPHPTHKGVVRPHRALDIKNPEGGQVVSAGDGTVRDVGSSGDLGNHVRIDYDNGYRGVYGHTAPSVKPGQRVRSGDPVGNTDLTGATSGPHVHYEVHDPETGQKLNPRDHLPMRLE